MLEICLKLPPDANLVTMATTYFGKAGKVIAWILYLFLFYSLSIAYVSGGGGFLRDWLGLIRSGLVALSLLSCSPHLSISALRSLIDSISSL